MSEKLPLHHKRWPWLAAALIMVLVFIGTQIEFGIGDTRPLGTVNDIAALSERDDVNVLFLLIDTLRASRLGSYGYERDTSPVLDQLASDGVRFDRHLAQSSWTKCSMASLWTSLQPPRSGVTRFNSAIPSEAVMPAEVLRGEGFLTAGLWRNGWVSGYFGFDQGFDVYTKPMGSGIPRNVRIKNPTLTNESTDDATIGSAVEFLRLHRDERWFLYLHLMDVHEFLYDEDSAVFGTANADIYDNAVLRENLVIRSLLEVLELMDLRKRTLVVVASDHGEAFGERGFEGHARAVFPETTEVPLIISFPFRLEPGVVVEHRTQNVDIWPTLFDLLGIDPPEVRHDGRSRLPDLLAAAAGHDSGAGADAYAFLDQSWGRESEPPSPAVAISRGSFRYVRGSNPGEGRQVELLLDRGTGEVRSIAEQHEDVMLELRALADAYLEQEAVWEGGAPLLDVNDMEKAQLRALGYAVP
jgi:arylsulfatase A-like enzyme